MVFNLINNQFGLFQFIKRYGGAIQELIDEINGFTTKTSGVYNPIFQWRNIKKRPYEEEPFDVKFLTHLTVTTVNTKSTVLPLSVCIDTVQQQKDSISIISDFDAEEIITLSVIKTCLPSKNTEKLIFLGKLLGNYINPLRINKSIKVNGYTPIQMQLRLKRNLITELGVYSNLTTNVSDKLNESIYIVRDVGVISDIELLDMIDTVETINAI